MLILKPEQEYLTISNTLQWRLQYARVIEKAGAETGLGEIIELEITRLEQLNSTFSMLEFLYDSTSSFIN